jgi:hypothetical protein
MSFFFAVSTIDFDSASNFILPRIVARGSRSLALSRRAYASFFFARACYT